MSNKYAKIIVKGSPISKSNFKLFNVKGRAILPYNSGKYHDRYALYEEEIAYETRIQNPNTVLDESLIAVLKVFYKSKKRHPDTNNIPKSIFDGIEKSGLIINDSQITKLIVEENYDEKNPRFELELFAESVYSTSYQISKKETPSKPIIYSPPPNTKKKYCINSKNKQNTSLNKNEINCALCGKSLKKAQAISANKGTLLICKDCLNKLF